MFTTIIFCLYRRLHAPLFRSPWLWMQWSVGPECSWSTVRHFWNKVVCPRGKFICNAESIFMYSSNQHLVLLFIRVKSCVCLTLHRSCSSLKQLVIYGQRTINKQGTCWKWKQAGLLHVEEYFAFCVNSAFLYTSFVKEQKCFDCMYQDISELQNKEEIASLEDLILLMAYWSNVASWVNFQVTILENSLWFHCSTWDILLLSDDEIVFSCGAEELNL